jgi:hypothetical protein
VTGVARRRIATAASLHLDVMLGVRIGRMGTEASELVGRSHFESQAANRVFSYSTVVAV